MDVSLCSSSERYKNGLTDRDVVNVEHSGGPKEPLLGLYVSCRHLQIWRTFGDDDF